MMIWLDNAAAANNYINHVFELLTDQTESFQCILNRYNFEVYNKIAIIVVLFQGLHSLGLKSTWI